MASTLMGRLQATLGLDTANFERGLSGASSRVRTFAQTTAAMAARVAGAMTAGIAAASGITLATINSAQEISRLSQVANTTPEAFQRWGAAASTVGIEQEKLADILKDVNDRVGDFLSTGGGPMKDFFENIAPKVGVTADQFRRLSGPEALQLYVSSLQKAGVNQQQMTFYLEAMASDATLLVPLLRNGGAEMERLGAKAAALGAVLDGKSIEAMKRSKAAMSEIGLAATGLRNQIATAALPMVEAFASALSSATSEGGVFNTGIALIFGNLDRLAAYATAAAVGFGTYLVGGMVAAGVAAISLSGAYATLRAAMLRSGIAVMIVGAGELILWFSRLVEGASGFGAALGLLGDVAAAVWDYIKSSAASLGPSISAIWKNIRAGFLEMVRAIQLAWFQLLVKMSKTAMSVGLDGLSKQLGQAAEGVGESFDEATQKVADLRSEAEALKKTAADLRAEGWDKVTDAVGKLVDAVTDAGEETDSTSDSITTMNDALNTTVGSAGAAKDKIKGVKEEMTELEKATEDWKGTWSDSFKDLIKGADDFGSALGRIADKLADLVLDSAFDSLWNGTGLGSWAGGILDSLGIGQNANGTENWRGGLTWVGERGKELVNLPSGTQIIPNHKLGAAAGAGALGGGGAVTFAPVIDARGADSSTVARLEAAVQRAQAEFAANVVTTVRDAQKKRHL